MARGGLHAGLFHTTCLVDTRLAVAAAPGVEFWSGLELLLLRQLVGSVVVYAVVVVSEHLLAADLERGGRCRIVVWRVVGLAERLLPLVVLPSRMLESPLAALLLAESE
jgi:hypothetical protein